MFEIMRKPITNTLRALAVAGGLGAMYYGVSIIAEHDLERKNNPELREASYNISDKRAIYSMGPVVAGGLLLIAVGSSFDKRRSNVFDPFN